MVPVVVRMYDHAHNSVGGSLLRYVQGCSQLLEAALRIRMLEGLVARAQLGLFLFHSMVGWYVL